MENQNIQWENWEEQPQENSSQQQGWGEQPQQEQPQTNWGEKQQQENIPTWGEQPQQEQPQQEQPQQNWGEQLPQENHNEEWDWEENSMDPLNTNTPSDFSELKVDDWEKKTSVLGLLPKLKIEALLYKFNYDDHKAVSGIDLDNLESLDNDGRYKIDFQNNNELIDILTAIKNIGESRGLKLQHSYLYKNTPNESIINISRGECQYNYIYFLKASYNSGDVVLDFSAINGPSEKVIDSSTGLLLLLPGWVPYSITKNQSTEDMVAISGRLIL